MKKVVCPACGLINLERFVTFPHCAGCGAKLSEQPVPRASVWRRPVGAPLWATIIGLCCAGLGVLGILTARETRRVEEKQLRAYVQLPRRVVVGRRTFLRIALDTTESAAPNADDAAPFEDVRLRFPRDLFENFALIKIWPAPDAITNAGSGRYFHFRRLAREQTLGILLRPRRAGTQRMELTLSARECLPLQLRGIFVVAPAPLQSRARLPSPMKIR